MMDFTEWIFLVKFFARSQNKMVTMMMSVTSLLWLGPPVVLVLIVIVVVDVVIVIELLKHAQYSVLDQLKLSHAKKTLTWSYLFVCLFVCYLFHKAKYLFVCNLHLLFT